jgi:hypothetical protein
MARRFLTHLDLSGNQILNAAFEKLSTDPTTGNFEGRIYYNTVDDLLKFYDGTQWLVIGAIKNIVGTPNEVTVAISNQVASVGLPDDVTITQDLTVGRHLSIVGDLTVSGTTTTVNTETINLADNILTLNSNLAASVSPTQDAGIEINRGSASTVALRWNETNDTWEATRDGSNYAEIKLQGDQITWGDITNVVEEVQDVIGSMSTGSQSLSVVYDDNNGTLSFDTILAASPTYLLKASGLSLDLAALETKLYADSFTKKVTANVGNGTNTSFAISHNLATRDVEVQVYDNSTYDTVECDVTRTDANTVTVSFTVAPTTNAYRVVIIG